MPLLFACSKLNISQDITCLVQNLQTKRIQLSLFVRSVAIFVLIPFTLNEASGFQNFALNSLLHIKVRKNATIRNRYNQVPHLTQATAWESDKNTRKHHIQESQEISSFPAV